MSAFLCSPETLASIASAYAIHVSDWREPKAYYFDLLVENLASLAYRYPPDGGQISEWYPVDGAKLFLWENIPTTFHTASELDEFCRSYQYQSCEHPEWEASEARKWTDELRAALVPLILAEKAETQKQIAQRQAALSSLPSLSPKETAVEIRRLLKANFPAVTFRVTTERGSMVSSVRVSWTDGPTEKRVDSLVSCFEAGHFDGMDDSYKYDRDRVLIVNGKHFRPGTRYIHTSREISASLANRCIAQVVNYFRGIDAIPTAVPSMYNGKETGGYTLEGAKDWDAIRPDLDHVHHSWRAVIHKAANDATEFARND